VTYRVVVASQAQSHISDQVLWLLQAGASQQRADSWFQGLMERVESLADMPRRHSVDELVSAARSQEIRRFAYGPYVVWFRIREEERIVEVIAFWHGGRLT